MLKFPRLLSALLVVVALTAMTALAQSSTSRILGRVVDSKDAVMAGATVTVINESTGITQTQTTTESGVYAFDSLPVGNYTVAVEQAGFKKFQKTGNALLVNTPLTIDIVMEVGQVSEVVTVQGGTEQLQTANATIGNVVEQKAIEALPLNGRNPLTLLLLEPGVVQRSAGGAGSGVHVNGARDRAYNVTIDGIEANESSVPNPVSNLYRINPDNVQEFKVTTNNATPEEGRNSGASISIATRSGTSEYHGTGFFFLRNEALNSNEFFANAQNTPKPMIRMGQYGFEMGGPIKKNKTFFFGSYQANRIDFTQPIDQTFGIPIVYTPEARNGIFRYFVPDPANPLVLSGQTITRNNPLLVNPATGALNVPLCATPTSLRCVRTYDIRSATNNPNNIAGRTFDSSVAGILTPVPSPNNFASGDGLNTAAFLWNPPTQVRGPAIAARIDHNFNENNSIFGRYLWSDYNTLKGDPLNGRPQVYPNGPALGEVFRRTSNLALSYRRVISPRIVNEFTAGFARFGFLFTQGEANPAWPAVPPFDFTSLSEPYINTPRTARWVTTPQLLDNLSLLHGAHVFRIGANLRFYRHVDQRGQPGGVNVTPSVTFSPTASNGRDPFSTAGGGFAAASGINASNDAVTLGGLINNLYGLPGRIQQVFISDLRSDVFLPFKTGDTITLYAEKHNLDQYNFYFQDEWKLRPNLTLNYGARWEINPPANTSPNSNVFVANTPIAGTPLPATPVVNQPGAVAFVKAKHWYEGSFNGAIGPRLGLAYSPDFKSGFLHTLFGDSSKSVIRVGYGIAFDTISSFQVTAAAGRIPGLVQSCVTTFPFTTITAGCVNSPDVNKTVAGGFPTQLPAPLVKPSTLLTPPQQLRTNSPPITVFAPQMQLPTVHEWNLSVQRELPWGLVMQAAYIGRRGTHLFMAYDINQINADAIVPSFLMLQANNGATNCLPSGATRDTTKPPCVPFFTPSQIPLLAAGVTGINATFVNSTASQGELNINSAGSFARRIEDTTLAFKLRPNQQFAVITYLDNSGDSNYHAAQFTLRRRFATGLGMSLAYTFGKSIDNQSVDPVGAASGGGLSTTNSRTPTDIRNFREERARSDFDRTQVLQLASVWELPVGRGQRFLSGSNGIVNQIFGGWTINSIYTFMTGEPFAVRSGSFTANGNHESRAVVLTPIQAQLQEIPNVAGPVLFKDNSAFAIPAPGQNGAGRNIFVAPHYWNLDLGFIKTFQITERWKLQFRTEMFNALNHPNFDNPRDASVGSPSIRSNVFAQTCCATVAPPSTQTIVQTGESARVIQFALKLQF
ncbi:MAG TPA: TonB-dependent receptor [Pyrinomonadaceae bacterium]|nr:TonB-dependent receptor [Pyrinomonadaceae bacterium]